MAYRVSTAFLYLDHVQETFCLFILLLFWYLVIILFLLLRSSLNHAHDHAWAPCAPEWF